MLRIYLTRQTRYPVDTKTIKSRVRDLLRDKGVSSAEVGIALVGTRKMKYLAKKYLQEDADSSTHEVLSFPSTNSRSEVEFVTPDVGKLQLGDIAICYPEARKIAIKRNRMMDDVVGELAEHGTLHLLGIHHE